MVEAISWVSSTFPYWNRRQGRDHIVSATHDYGACYDYLRNSAHRAGIVSELKKSIILSTFGDTKSKCFNADHHITIPTYLAVPSLGINSKRMRADWSKAVGLQLPLAVDDPLWSRGRGPRMGPGPRIWFCPYDRALALG